MLNTEFKIEGVEFEMVAADDYTRSIQRYRLAEVANALRGAEPGTVYEFETFETISNCSGPSWAHSSYESSTGKSIFRKL